MIWTTPVAPLGNAALAALAAALPVVVYGLVPIGRIAGACAACGLSGREGELLRRAMPLSLGLCGLVALLTLATTHLAPGLVPSPGPAAVPQAADPAAGLGLLGLSLVLAALVARLGRRCERTVPVVSSPGR